MDGLAVGGGGSLAMVDRALNGRERLKLETLAHIIAIARQIGHPAAQRFGGGASLGGSRCPKWRGAAVFATRHPRPRISLTRRFAARLAPVHESVN